MKKEFFLKDISGRGDGNTFTDSEILDNEGHLWALDAYDRDGDTMLMDFVEDAEVGDEWVSDENWKLTRIK